MRPKANPVGNPREAAKPASEVETVDEMELPVARQVEVPAAPEHLDLDEVGQDMWNKIWTDGAGAYRSTDVQTIGMYCVAYQRWVVLLKLVAKEGLTTAGSKGQTVVHPAAKQLDAIESKLLSLSNVLGLNPESRIRLGIASTDLSSRIESALSEFT